MSIIIFLIISALDVFLWIIIANIVISWLVVFDVLNIRNKWIYKGCALINRLVEPAMGQCRRIIPPIGGMDLSPMVLIFGIYIVQGLLYGLLR